MIVHYTLEMYSEDRKCWLVIFESDDENCIRAEYELRFNYDLQLYDEYDNNNKKYIMPLYRIVEYNDDGTNTTRRLGWNANP